MRRRRAIDVWPAFADLMTILSVPGLFLALGLLSVLGDQALEVFDEEARQARLRQEAKNRAMVQAIEEVQKIIDAIAMRGELQFSQDQTLQFGDDLVTFDLNSTTANWKEGGPERLRRFCGALQQQLNGSGARANLFSVEVEGHTDSTSCPGDRFCNWDYSSRRATAFMATMRDGSLCPGGQDLDLKPIGFADTKPLAETGGEPHATRRIALRIVPNYGAIIDAVEL